MRQQVKASHYITNSACGLESSMWGQWYRLYAIKNKLQLKQNIFFWDSGEGICVTGIYDPTGILLLFFKVLPEAHDVSR